MNLVLQHPAFNENPLATIQEHLKNEICEVHNAMKGKVAFSIRLISFWFETLYE